MHSLKRRRIQIAAALLILASLGMQSASAGVVTWEFVEFSGPHPGAVGGTLSIGSPPVVLSPGAPWVAHVDDFAGFSVLDQDISSDGAADVVVAGQASGAGVLLQNSLQAVEGQSFNGVVASFTEIHPPGTHQSVLWSDRGRALGDWVFASAVPEPSTLGLVVGMLALVAATRWHWREPSRAGRFLSGC